MNITKKLLLFLLLSCCFTFAETTLSGKIGGMTLDSAGSPYKVTSDLHVEPGKTLTLKPGCVLLFKPFSSLIVDGSLIVEGSKEKPVVLTSINDGQYNDSASGQPQPFDWNGVTITREAETVNLTNFLLCYSVYGVKFQADKVMINNGVFHSNGQFNVTVKDKVLKVTENFPFTYGETQTKKSTETRDIHKNIGIRRPLAIACEVAGAASLAASGYFLSQKMKYADEYNNEKISENFQPLKDKQQTALTECIIFGVTGAVLLPTGVVLYLSDKNKRNAKAVSIVPVFGTETGLLASLNF